MIVEFHNCYLVKSINRRAYFIVKGIGSYFSIYRNAAQLWIVTYFFDTVQSLITPLICSPEQYYTLQKNNMYKLYIIVKKKSIYLYIISYI
jgi:tyrosine-protein phosphatase YwqE